MREGKPPGCCDREQCPWKHVNDPAKPQAAAAGAADQSHLGSTDDWIVCKCAVDPTNYGWCEGPQSRGKSPCDIAVNDLRRRLFPGSRNNRGKFTGRPRTPEGDRNGRPRTPTGDRSSRPRTPTGDRSGRPRTPSRDRGTRPRTPEGGRRGDRTRSQDRSDRPRTPRGSRAVVPDPRGLMAGAAHGQETDYDKWDVPRGPTE